MQSIRVTIKGKDFERCFTNPDVLERYEEALDTALKEAEKANEEEKDSVAVRKQCEAICKCVDTILGEGSSDILFEEGIDLLTCLDVYAELCEMKEKQIVPAINEKKAKYSMARARREIKSVN